MPVEAQRFIRTAFIFLAGHSSPPCSPTGRSFEESDPYPANPGVPWLTIHARPEPSRACRQGTAALLDARALLITSGDVLSETNTHLRYHAGHALALQFYLLVQEAKAQHRLQILWVDPAVFAEAWAARRN